MKTGIGVRLQKIYSLIFINITTMTVSGKPVDVAKTLKVLAKVGEIFEFEYRVGVVIKKELRGCGFKWKADVKNLKIYIWRK